MLGAFSGFDGLNVAKRTLSIYIYKEIFVVFLIASNLFYSHIYLLKSSVIFKHLVAEFHKLLDFLQWSHLKLIILTKIKT